jgi:hypothetical protein
MQNKLSKIVCKICSQNLINGIFALLFFSKKLMFSQNQIQNHHHNKTNQKTPRTNVAT